MHPVGVLAPRAASNRARVPPWVLEEGVGKKRMGQRRGRQGASGQGGLKRVRGRRWWGWSQRD